jgi:hypothetical protein
MAMLKKSTMTKGKLIPGGGEEDGVGKEDNREGKRVKFKTEYGNMGVTITPEDEVAVRRDSKWGMVFGDKAAAMHAMGFKKYTMDDGTSVFLRNKPGEQDFGYGDRAGNLESQIGYAIPYGKAEGRIVAMMKDESGRYIPRQANLFEGDIVRTGENMFNEYINRTMREYSGNVQKLKEGGRYRTRGEGGKRVEYQGEIPQGTKEQAETKIQTATGGRGTAESGQYDIVKGTGGQIGFKKKTSLIRK